MSEFSISEEQFNVFKEHFKEHLDIAKNINKNLEKIYKTNKKRKLSKDLPSDVESSFIVDQGFLPDVPESPCTSSAVSNCGSDCSTNGKGFHADFKILKDEVIKFKSFVKKEDGSWGVITTEGCFLVDLNEYVAEQIKLKKFEFFLNKNKNEFELKLRLNKNIVKLLPFSNNNS